MSRGRGVGGNACNWQHFSISAAIWFSTGLARNTVHNILQPVNHCDCSLEFRSRSSSIGDCVCFQIHCFFSRLSVCRTARQVKRPGRCPGWSLDSHVSTFTFPTAQLIHPHLVFFGKLLFILQIMAAGLRHDMGEEIESFYWKA